MPQSSALLGRGDRRADLLDDDLVRLERPVDHARDLLGAVGRPRDGRQLGRVARIADRDAAEALDALGEQVDQLGLLLVVLVEEQVQLIEGRAGDQPVVLLVEAGEDHAVGEDLVEQLAAPRPRLVGQADRQAAEGAVALDLAGAGVELRIG